MEKEGNFVQFLLNGRHKKNVKLFCWLCLFSFSLHAARMYYFSASHTVFVLHGGVKNLPIKQVRSAGTFSLFPFFFSPNKANPLLFPLGIEVMFASDAGH